MDLPIRITDQFHITYPEAAVGVMILSKVNNPKNAPELSDIKRGIESRLKEQFTDKAQLRNHPTIQAYKGYYKKFKKSYHVLFQLESVIFNGRSIPDTNALIQAMFMAELDNMLLTAGHDLSAVRMPVTIGLGSELESYTLMNGSEQVTKPNDMLMADSDNIISSVIYGPDKRTRIHAKTQSAMFVVYAPAGIQPDQINKHLSDIYKYVQIFAPAAEIQLEEIL